MGLLQQLWNSQFSYIDNLFKDEFDELFLNHHSTRSGRNNPWCDNPTIIHSLSCTIALGTTDKPNDIGLSQEKLHHVTMYTTLLLIV